MDGVSTTAPVQPVVLADADALAWEAAARLAAAARSAVKERGQFTIALSGGTTPQRLFALLALAEWQVRMLWPQTQVFWADERCVPPDHPDSNFGAAHAALLARLVTAPAMVHRWLGEKPDADAEAVRYAQVLRAHVPLDGHGMPVLDLVLLGMGADGHTASLFPHTDALRDVHTSAVATRAPVTPHRRLTLTIPVLCAARAVVVMVSGAEKAATLRRVLHGPYEPDTLPVQRLRERATPAVWLVDRAAAVPLPADEG